MPIEMVRVPILFPNTNDAHPLDCTDVKAVESAASIRLAAQNCQARL